MERNKERAGEQRQLRFWRTLAAREDNFVVKPSEAFRFCRQKIEGDEAVKHSNGRPMPLGPPHAGRLSCSFEQVKLTRTLTGRSQAVKNDYQTSVNREQKRLHQFMANKYGQTVLKRHPKPRQHERKRELSKYPGQTVFESFLSVYWENTAYSYLFSTVLFFSSPCYPRGR